MKHLYTLLLLLFIATGTAWGQILTFEFSALAGNEATANSNFNNENLTSSTISRGAGLTASNNGGRFNATGWATASIANAVSGNNYMEFTITPNSGYQFSISSIVMQWQRSSTGNTAVALRSSADSYTTNLGGEQSITDNTSTQTLTFTFTQSNITAATTYRIYSYAETSAGSGGPGDGAGNDITVNGTVDVFTAEEPTITTSVLELSGFNYTEGAGPSASQSFEVNGLELDPAAGDVTVSGTASFEVSSDDETFGATATISYTDGAFADELIYVRLKADLDAEASISENITITGGGIAEDVEVTVSGSVFEELTLPYSNEFRTTTDNTNATDLGFTINNATNTASAGGYLNISNGGYLQSPSIDLTSYESVRFEFDATTFGGALGQTLTLKMSDDGGSTFDNIESNALSGLYVTYTIDVDVEGLYDVVNAVFRVEMTAGTGSSRFRDFSVAELISPSASLTGSAGWRLLSSPVSGSTYADLLGPIWTQGATGADATNGTPNVFWSEGSTTASLNATNVTNLNNTIPAGRGFAVLVFDDDDYTGPGGIVWPKTLSVTGTENAADVTYTPAWTSGTEYAIAGNPFASTIDWDNVTKGADVHNAVWVWNPATSTYDDYNGDNGNLTGGLIAPFQGFWVQYNGTDRGITFPSAAKSTGGSFRGKEETPRRMVVRASDSAGSNLAWVAFRDGATLGEDRYDAVKFTPLSSDYIQAFTIAADKAHGINVLPSDLTDALEIPFGVTSTRGGLVTLDLTELNLPEGWMVSIRDNVTNETRAMNADFNYTFEASRAKAAPASETPQVLAANDPRFTLIVDPLGTTSVDGNQKSEIGFALAQNYPNPFNPSTQIRFTLQSSDVTRLTVYDVVGRQVAVLVNGTMPAGSHSITFDASNLTSGVYIYKLEAGGQVITKRMTLLK